MYPRPFLYNCINMMRFLSFLYLLLAPLVASADFLPKHFIAKMEQEYVSIRQNSVRVDPIEIKYMFKGHFIFQNTGTDKVTYVCNPNKVWIYTPALFDDMPGEVKIAKSGTHCYSKLFDSLSSGLVSNVMYQVAFKDRKAMITFSKEESAKLGLVKLDLHFKSTAGASLQLADLDKIIIFKENNARPVTLKLKELNSQKQLTAVDFNFQIPSGAQVVELK